MPAVLIELLHLVHWHREEVGVHEDCGKSQGWASSGEFGLDIAPYTDAAGRGSGTGNWVLVMCLRKRSADVPCNGTEVPLASSSLGGVLRSNKAPTHPGHGTLQRWAHGR